MKFAKELEENAVPEWRGMYLDYKGGKKKLKAVARAIRNVEKSSKDGKKHATSSNSPLSSLRDAPVRSFLSRDRQKPAQGSSQASNLPFAQQRSRSAAPCLQVSQQNDLTPSASRPIEINDRSPLRGLGNHQDDGPRMTRYGSIIGSPPQEGESGFSALQQAPSLTLPDAAIDLNREEIEDNNPDYDRPASPGSPTDSTKSHPPATQLAHTGNAYEIGRPVDNLPGSQFRFQGRRTNSTLSGNAPWRRVFSTVTPSTPGRNVDVALEAYREIDFRRAEFFYFLDTELLKVENFYKSKEIEAIERLKVIREQLHIMRNRRMEEILIIERKRQHNEEQAKKGIPTESKSQKEDAKILKMRRKLHPFAASVDYASEAISKVRPGRIGKTTEAMEQLGTPTFRGVNNDYERRPVSKEVAYRTAKRKLKIALAEHYRSLELLKSYALLNRTAFRKINKKFDKTVKARPPGQYMEEKVNTAYFVSSEAVEQQIQAVEDLYARYFERGSHKIAVGKLRAKTAGAGQYSGSTFRTGLFLAAGAVFGIQGLVYGIDQDLNHADEVRKTQASYLLQLYAGYFFIVLLVSLFTIDAGIFSRAKVNYQFIFEFDTRHMLDWKQLAELPAIFFCLLGLIVWCNFNRWGGEIMYVYWPVILIGLSIVLLFFPPPFLYARSRGWLLYSNWRLAFAGYYPVEFRDFFLGDMFCSLTYAMGNIELFFCLYAHHWTGESQCNSSNSHLLGFFTALPGIWRLLQCLRRYRDTRDWFPHLANGGKYSFTILQQISLSLYRMNHNTPMKSFFIFCALVNAIYCSIWDIIMDWSLTMNPYIKPPLLRPVLAYRRHYWVYYMAMVVDPIVRFNWIFYAIFTEDTQHSAAVSFFIALTEIFRRGIWILFRVENEHCTNVGRFRAVRNAPLPYELAQDVDQMETSISTTTGSSPEGPQPEQSVQTTDASHSTAADVEHGTTSSVRQRKQSQPSADSPVASALKRVGTTMLSAHARDYERKKPADESKRTYEDTDDDEEDYEDDSDN
ncbi:Hypothetical protein R9X50_00673100 [Acrodontium crateriforme]|uniref:Uncharacterized protein n=1 Tax=Acrodontium crateriforme TaxID=150365 RepID=A0AAQ3MBF7_9PEZI|nr:Hypothetical protein R9X50_00673100 [Acrodontium crateriforme]